jgi:transposase
MENSKKIFEIALQLEAPWYIKDIQFKATKNKTQGRLDIYLDFPPGFKFKDDEDIECAVHDTKMKTWRHLDFFQHTCYLHARVPRIRTSSGSIRLVEVPWARPNNGFTLLFEAFAMTLIECEMPIRRVAKTLNTSSPRLWRVFSHWINQARKKVNLDGLKKIGMDETSSRRGHNYIMVSVDLDQKRVIYASPGKDENTVSNLCNYLKTKEIEPDSISHFSIDMSPALIAGIRNNFPDSTIVYDRFHLKKLLNESMDDLRRLERKEHELLKGQRYTFLRKQKDLTDDQKQAKFELTELFPRLGEGVRFVELFDDFYTFKDNEQAAGYLAWWCDHVDDSDIFAFKKFVKTVKAHWSGIITWYDHKISNGLLEGINSKIQLAKARARGYRNIENFINMIYFIAGDLEFDYPHKTL